MSAGGILLVAVICAGAAGLGRFDACEEAEVRAASCAEADAYLRAGLRAGQTLRVLFCEVRP